MNAKTTYEFQTCALRALSVSSQKSTVPKKCVCCTKGKGSPVGDHCFTLLISPQAVALALAAAVAPAAALAAQGEIGG